MDLRQLEIIRAIADSGSFTAAGEKLHVSQSAISRQVLLLEEELGEPVFHRIGRRIRITPAGESLLQLSHRVFPDLQETVSTISEKPDSLSGPSRPVGGMTVCLCVLPTPLAEVRRVHPAHPLAKKKSITAADLDGQDFVLFETGAITRRLVEQFFARENVGAEVIMETENVEIIKAMVRNGLGISIIPSQAAASDVKAG